MSGDCFFLNPLQRDGTSQRQRAPAALDPDYARIDERSLVDLLAYARRYAELLSFRAPTNHESGDWVEFIEADVSAAVALIRKTEADWAKEAFEAQVALVEQATTDDDVRDRFAVLFDPILDVARAFARWHDQLDPKLEVWRDLDRLIRAALVEALRDAVSISLHLEEASTPQIDSIEADVARLGDAWEVSTVEPAALGLTGQVRDEEREAAIDRVSAVFDRFYEAYVFIAAKTEIYLEETLEQYPRHRPHMALFLAILGLFQHAQEHLNSLGAAHLDFYYEDVLGLERKPATPDEAHILFTLAKNAEPHLVEKDTALKAGKDASGRPLEYRTTEELVVNRAVVDEEHGLKTVFVQRDQDAADPEQIVNIHAAPDADSADGVGADLTGEEGKWATLGSIAMPFATVGFAIASPMLALSEGSRTIDIGLVLADHTALTDEAKDELVRNVLVYVTCESGWLRVPVGSLSIRTIDGMTDADGFAYRLEIGADQEPIVAYDKKTHGGGFDTDHPVVKFLLSGDGLASAAYQDIDPVDASDPDDRPLKGVADLGVVDYSSEVESYAAGAIVRHQGRLFRNAGPDPIEEPGVLPGVDPRWQPLAHSYPYRYFDGVELVDLDIRIEVVGVRTLLLENDVGLLDPAKPFMPFGPVPKAGSNFYIGSPEIFAKPLESIDLRIDWADLPTVNFADYYSLYTDTSNASIINGNADFEAGIAILDAGVWQGGVAGAKNLFEGAGGASGDPPEGAKTFTLTLSDPLPPAPGLEPFARFDVALRRGFVRMSLERDFLHRDYPRLLAEAVAPGGGDVPNPPYTPLMASLALDFVARHRGGYDGLSRESFEDRVEQLFQIGPFGHREIFPIADDPSAAGVPIDRSPVLRFPITVLDSSDNEVEETAEGSLLLGIAQLEPPQNLTVLFRVAEGSEDPSGEIQEVVWSYLAREEWVDFDDTELLADGTNGLLRSGIMKFAVPKSATVSETLLPGRLHWIKASVRRQTASIPKLIAVHTQAVVARFHDRNNAPTHLASALPAGTIAKLDKRDAAIKKVSQPYASFGGRLEEEDRAFRVRVSERLRHKGRAVAIFDYERLVLEQFPEVYKVKCLNHADGDREHVPGHVELVVVPNLRNQNAVDPLRPRFSLNKLDAIREFLDDVSSDFTTVHVCNPSYEAVRSRFKVRFHRGRDRGLYTSRLQSDLIRFLSPWLYDAAADLTFGGLVHRSSILNFVEELDYVDFVTDFELDQLVEKDGVVEERNDLEEAIATTSSAALVSATDHRISHDIVSCTDNA